MTRFRYKLRSLAAIAVASATSMALAACDSEPTPAPPALDVAYDGDGWIGRSPAFWPRDITVGDDGHVHIAGQFIQPDGMGGGSIQVYDDDGRLLWTRSIDAAVFGYRNKAWALTTDYESNVYVVGLWNSHGDDGFIRKYDELGDSEWKTSLNDGVKWVADGLTSVDVNDQGEVLVGGSLRRSFEDHGYGLAAKYSPKGKQMWQRTFGNSWSMTHDVAFDHEGNAYVVGQMAGSPNTRFGRSYSPVAETVVFQNAEPRYLDSVVQKPSAGPEYTPISLPPPRDAYIAKYDPEGKILWSDRFAPPDPPDPALGFSGWTTFDSIAVGPSGAAYATLWSNRPVPEFGSTGTFFMKYDSEGNIAWTRPIRNTFDYSGQTDVVVDNNGGLYVASSVGVDKFDRDGNLLWAVTYPRGEEPFHTAVSISPSGDVYMSGLDGGLAGYVVKLVDSDGNPLYTDGVTTTYPSSTPSP